MAGLRPELKSKVVGSDGNFEQLMTKAKFEEAKNPLAMVTPSSSYSRRFMDQKGATSKLPSVKSQLLEGQSGRTGKCSTTKGCFNCGLTTHLVKECPYPSNKREIEKLMV